MKITFESKPVYGEDVKYIKTKIKTYEGNIITNFHNKKMSKEKAPCKYLPIIEDGRMQVYTRKDKNWKLY